MVTAKQLLVRLRELGATLVPAGDRLRVSGADRLPEDVREEARARKEDLLAELRREVVERIKAIYDRLAAGFPPPEWELRIVRLRPDGRWLPALRVADVDLDRAVAHYFAGELPPEGFGNALSAYEGTWRESLTTVATAGRSRSLARRAAVAGEMVSGPWADAALSAGEPKALEDEP